MADTDTIDKARSAKLQVASLPPADSGRGLARVPAKVMAELGLTEGDVIEIEGKRTTAARAIRPYNEDEKLDIIRLDGLQRANAGVGSGDFVEVRRGTSKPATRVVFAPAQNNIRLQGSSEALKRSFATRPLTAGDTVATIRVFVKPLVVWMWIGGAVMAVGTLLAAFPTKRKRRPTDATSAPITTADAVVEPEGETISV